VGLTCEQLVGKSIVQRKRGRYAEALVSAEAAVEVDECDANAWWQVALNRLSLDQAHASIQALERVVELAPHFASGWAVLGKTLLNEGRKQDAKPSYAPRKSPWLSVPARTATAVRSDGFSATA
jgi:tetratricopeptide (TPR) repeat protein